MSKIAQFAYEITPTEHIFVEVDKTLKMATIRHQADTSNKASNTVDITSVVDSTLDIDIKGKVTKIGSEWKLTVLKTDGINEVKKEVTINTGTDLKVADVVYKNKGTDHVELKQYATTGQINTNDPRGLKYQDIAPAIVEGISWYDGADGVLYLNWAANSETDLAGYNVYTSEISSTGAVSSPIKRNSELRVGNTFSFQLAEGNYKLYVTAVDLNGNESDPQSIPLDVNMNAPTPPAAPEGVYFLDGLIGWNSNSIATGYNVYRAYYIDGMTPEQANWSVVNEGLVQGTTKVQVNASDDQYMFAVTALNNGGESPKSQTVYVAFGQEFDPFATTPTTPIDEATPIYTIGFDPLSIGQFNISASYYGIDGAVIEPTSMTIYYRVSGTETWSVAQEHDASTQSFNISDLTQATEYEVRAVDLQGNDSGSILFTTQQ